MSRIGKMSIAIPAGVSVEYKDSVVTVKGAKGTLSQKITGAIDDLGDAPVLVFAELARLDDTHRIADAALVLFVVRLEAAGVGNGLFIERVRALLGDGDHDGLVHLVGNDDAHDLFSQISFHVLPPHFA